MMGQGPPHPPQALYTQPRRSKLTLDFPEQFQDPLTNPNPSLHIQYPLLPQKLSMPSQVLHTNLNPLTPILDPIHPTTALHTLIRPLTLISGPPYLSKALHNHLRYYVPIRGPSNFSLTFYTYLRPYTPVPGPPVARGMVLSVYKLVVCANQFYIRIVMTLK